MNEIDITNLQNISAPVINRPPIKITYTLKIFYIILLIIMIIAVISDIFEIRLLKNIQNDAVTTDKEINANDSRQALIGTIQIAISLPTWIIFLIWTYRANLFLHRTGIQGMQYTPGWSVGWYFIPIANFWKPYLALREIWIASKYPSSDWKTKSANQLVSIWWTVKILTMILSKLSFRLSYRAEEFEEIMTSAYVTLSYDIIRIPLYIIYFALVSKIIKMQMEQLKSSPLLDEKQ